MTDAGDIITDFTAGTGGDNLDLSNLFNNIGIASSSVNTNYLQFVQSGAGPNTIVQIDQNGLTGGANFVTIATLNNINPAQLAIGGNVIV
jgi:hypothetical protein